MFPSIWDQASDATRLMIAASPDGKLWDWVPGGTVLDTGDFQTFDGGCLFASPNLIELGNGDFALPYSGYRFPHKYPRGHEGFPPNLGYAVWPKGRMIALEAAQLGEFATVAVVPPGTKLRINAVTRRGGSIRIEACDINRQPLPGRTFADCQPIIGDQFRTLVTWQGGDDLGIQPARPWCSDSDGSGEDLCTGFRVDRHGNTCTSPISSNPDLTVDEFIDVLRRSTLAERRPVDDPETMRGMLEHADIIVTARTARAAGRRVPRDYRLQLLHIPVRPGRGRGLSASRDRPRTDPAHARSRRARHHPHPAGGPKAASYYPHIGMTRHDSCWVVPRR